jgi:nucleoside-diphosphate-sugar epimerase
MKVFVTGGCGYKGSVLVPRLLAAGHTVTAYDTMWFGDALARHERLEVIEGDVRSPEAIDLRGVDAIVHLASIANDPCGELNPKLTWEVGALATMRLADRAVRNGVRQFLYASSGSVYGIKSEDHVTEDLTLEPVSDYNKSKMVAERVLLSYGDRMSVQIVRPATVCGYSPRMRFDVSVNMLTMQALTRGEVTVFGGDQTRPNIHIEDIADVYLHFLARPTLTGVYNAGFENLTIREIAERVTRHVPARITVTPSADPRSYRLSSEKLLATGFRPRRTVDDAIQELVRLHSEGRLHDEDRFHNLRWMQRNVVA